MVMENEIRLGDILDKLTPSDRLVIYNAARQVVYRGYAANAVHGTVNPQRRIKKMGLGMETYRATEQMWDWEKTDRLPEQIPVEQFSKYRVEDLQHILYIRIELKSDSLWRIAQRFYGNGAACYALAHRNGIKNPDLIYPGQVLKI